MKRGLRVVHGEKELIEKLGRNDPCPCGSGRRFQGLLPQDAPVSSTGTITFADEALRSVAEPSSDKGPGGGSIPPGATSLSALPMRIPVPEASRRKLVVVGMVSNGFSIADPDDAGMLDVVGFDAAAPQVIADS